METASSPRNLVASDVGILTAPDGRQFVLALFCHGLPVPPTGPDWGVDHPGALALTELAQQVGVKQESEQDFLLSP